MVNKRLELAPGTRFAAAMGLGLLVLGAVLWLALWQPWLGVNLYWDPAAQAGRVRASHGPGAGVAAGTQVAAIQGDGRSHRFEALDFVVEPDGNLVNYAGYRRFLQNQGLLARIQAAPQLERVTPDGQRLPIAPATHRPAWDLPADFWVQWVVGLLAWTIAAGVWAFRPHNVAARYMLINGATVLLFAPGAAVYTTRELAIPLPELLVLKTMNFGGGLLFCGSMVALLLVYPRRIGWRGLGLLVMAAYAAWFVLQAQGAFDSMILGRRVPVFVALLAVTWLAAVQWVRSDRDPVARAALRWFLLSWLVGIGLFVLLVMVPQVLEVDTGALQGYSFLLFLVIYGGMALGILRFRLFDLGLWWFRTLAWIVGALILVFLDLLFLYQMRWTAEWSLSVSLLLCALLWLPFRNWLWGRVMHPTPPTRQLFSRVMHVALAPTDGQRAERWGALLRSLFDPLEIRPGPSCTAVGIEDDGICLRLPAVAHSPALVVRYPGGGRRLFDSTDIELAGQLVDMLRHAEESRHAYEQGSREERNRIACDLHDDVGAVLLTGMHQTSLAAARESMGQAIDEMRIILRGLSGQHHPLEMVESDLRHKLGERLDAAGIQMAWRGLDGAAASGLQLDYIVYRNIVSALREIVSNIIRHAHATQVEVQLDLMGGYLGIEISDNGRGFDVDAARGQGLGLPSVRRRIENLEGRIRYASGPGGTTVVLQIPLQP